MNTDTQEIDIPGVLGFIARLTGIKPKHQKGVFLFLGVIAMAVHVAWICGWLAVWGAEVPYARADDVVKTNVAVAQLAQTVKEISSSMNQSLALNIAGEIRAQVKLRCDAHSSQAVRDLIDGSIDNLQARYFALTQRRYHEPGCDTK